MGIYDISMIYGNIERGYTDTRILDADIWNIQENSDCTAISNGDIFNMIIQWESVNIW